MLASLTAFAITSAARLLTGARAGVQRLVGYQVDGDLGRFQARRQDHRVGVFVEDFLDLSVADQAGLTLLRLCAHGREGDSSGQDNGQYGLSSRKGRHADSRS